MESLYQHETKVQRQRILVSVSGWKAAEVRALNTNRQQCITGVPTPRACACERVTLNLEQLGKPRDVWQYAKL